MDSDCMMGILATVERSIERSTALAYFLTSRASLHFVFVLYLLPARAGRLFGFWMDLIPFLFGGFVSLVTKRGMKSYDGNDGLMIDDGM